jgi:acetyl-CoA carboxylase carboxyl transferase subunit beta
MNWLSNYVRPRIRAVLKTRKETPENLWEKCAGCGQMLYVKDFEASLRVCPQCGHHHRLNPVQRFDMLFDEETYTPVDLTKASDDPLKFRDQKKYTDRLKEARAKTGTTDAIEVATGRLGGIEVTIAAQNFFFMGGSLGQAAGEAFLAAAKKAVELKTPMIMITAAGGARMQEGILSLMQMPRTTIGVQMLHEADLPYLVVLTDPTTGGVTASYAMLGDVAIAEPGALIGFAGPRVIEDTIREKLPQGFQRSEYLLQHGIIDMVVERAHLRETLIRIVDLLVNTRKPKDRKALPGASASR